MLLHDGIVAYKAIFEAITARVGIDMTIAITGMGPKDVDKREPMTSILCLLRPVLTMFGEIPTRNLIREALEDNFVSSYALEVQREIFEHLDGLGKEGH